MPIVIGACALALGTTVAARQAVAHGGHGCGQALQSQIPALFAQADTNGDGSLSPDEFRTFHQLVREKRAECVFQRLDANGDGKVTLDELNAAHAARRAHRHGMKRGQ